MSTKLIKIGVKKFGNPTIIPEANYNGNRGRCYLSQEKIAELESKHLSYDGDIYQFPFPGRQRFQFDELQSTFSKLGNSVANLKGCLFTNNAGQTVSRYIAYSSDENIIWHKSQSPGIGSGQNILYIGNQKIKTSDWLQISSDEQKNFYNNALGLHENAINKHI
jgi:hypothetical protein